MLELGAVLTAIVTPFDDELRVNEESFVALMRHLAANGSDGFVVAGTTGEAATLSEARSLLRGAGWTETKSERFVNPEKFPGAWAEFSKGHDYCRITVTEGTGLQQVDITVARLNGAP